MALKIDAYPIILSATQGSADAFKEGSVSTGLTGRQAYNLKSVAIQLVTDAKYTGSWTRYQVALSRRSKTSFPTLADPDVIYMLDFGGSYITSGAFGIAQSWVYNFPRDVPIVEETLYLEFDSANTAVASTLILRGEVELDTISDVDRLNLITRSLS